jgi:hypothetical protein
MLTDGDSLLDKMVQILGDFRSKTAGLQDTEDLVTGDGLDLGNTMRITENDTNLSRRKTLLGILADHVNDFLRSGLDPRSGRATVGEGTTRDTLTRSIHTTHFD